MSTEIACSHTQLTNFWILTQRSSKLVKNPETIYKSTSEKKNEKQKGAQICDERDIIDDDERIDDTD